MFYSWTDIEELGYSNVEDFIKKQYEKNKVEEMISFPEGIEIKVRPNFPYPDIDYTKIENEYVQCKVFSKIYLTISPEEAFNLFCKKNKIKSKNIIQVTYENNDIFLVYNKEL